MRSTTHYFLHKPKCFLDKTLSGPTDADRFRCVKKSHRMTWSSHPVTVPIRWILLLTFFFLTGAAFCQNAAHVYGFVKDAQTGEVLPGATVYNVTNGKGVVSDYNGYFNIDIKHATTLKIAYVGYVSQTVAFNKASDTLVTIMLESSNLIEEVVVETVKHTTGNVATLSRKELMQIPSLGGKPDVAKALQLLPGINTQNEGSGLLQVRGGDPGQNLYLFDNVAVIYVNHLGGFMSVFNPEIITNIDVYKGAFPARYGGKLSSVVDITQKSGDNTKLHGNYSIGLTDVSFCLEGPTKLENSSFIITARKTLTDPLMLLATGIGEGNDFSVAYGFHDINSKLTWNPNTRNKLHINFYYGDDYLLYWKNDKTEKNSHKNTWGNVLLAGHWKSVLNSSLYANSSLSFSRYRLKTKQKYTLHEDNGLNEYYKKSLSSVSDLSLSSSLKHTLTGNISNTYGVKASLYSFLPFSSVQSDARISNRDYTFSNETALFGTSKITFLHYSELNAGLRGVMYNTNSFSDYSIEPRINIALGINKKHHLTAGYMQTKQFAHLLLTSGSVMLNEVWIAAGEKVKPASVTQYNAGYKMDYTKINIQVDLFYKQMNSLAMYKEGFMAFEGDGNWLSKVEPNGSGMAKGLEVFIKKPVGDITGFISYTLSKANRQYNGINNGNTFLFDYDRTHSFAAYAHYKISDNIGFNITWVYQTGLPFTPAIGKTYYAVNEGGNTEYYERLIYGKRNSDRLRDYHRLDVGINYTKTNKRKRKAIWSFSVYNLYNRQNPYYYYYNTNNTGEIIMPETGNETLSLKMYQMCFFTMIPTVSYKVFFEKGDRIKPKKNIDWHKWLYME